MLRSSLSVPELRFNRQTYFEGYNTISPGGGLKIKSFVANSDGSYIITPDLEEGVPLGQKPDDILLGFWHDKSVTTGDFIGFRKVQYRITSADYNEKTFVMVPRPGYEFVPHNEMRLGQTGNFTDKERQTYIIIDVRDGNCCITLVDNANTWDPEPAQMKSWFGKKKGMTINGINCDRFSAVLQDIIMTGLIFKLMKLPAVQSAFLSTSPAGSRAGSMRIIPVCPIMAPHGCASMTRAPLPSRPKIIRTGLYQPPKVTRVIRGCL